jgi:hypothetical protein
VKRVFIELPHFTKSIKEIENGEQIKRSLEIEILKNPEAGDLIQGTGGIRKIRIGDPKRNLGKSGAFRILYLDWPRLEITLLVLIFTKAKQENITSIQKNQIKELVQKIKKELENYEI